MRCLALHYSVFAVCLFRADQPRFARLVFPSSRRRKTDRRPNVAAAAARVPGPRADPAAPARLLSKTRPIRPAAAATAPARQRPCARASCAARPSVRHCDLLNGGRPGGGARVGDR